MNQLVQNEERETRPITNPSEDLDVLRQMFSELRSIEDAPRLTVNERKLVKRSIKALRTAMDAVEALVVA